jgi:hypothetical protein
MPVPIVPMNTDYLMLDQNKPMTPQVDYGIDVSLLPFVTEKQSKANDIIKVSNFEAGILFKLWKDSSGSASDEKIPIPETVSQNDVLRLKASGLISGDIETFTYTSRGREVIKTLVLSEENSFDKSSETKGLQEILADKKKKFGNGPRLSVGK